MKIISTIRIDNTPQKVWYWLGNPENAVKWQKNIAGTEILHKTDDWVATTFRETIEENGKSTEMEGVVTGYVENSLLSMRLSGKYNTVDIEWSLEEKQSQTTLHVRAEVRFRSVMKVISSVLFPVLKKSIVNQLNSELAQLKRLCENG